MKPFLSSSLAVAALVVPSAAFAVENTVEFQLDASVVLDLVEQRARLVETGCPEPFSDGFTEWIVDHIEWGIPTLGSATTTSTVQFSEGSVATNAPTVSMPLDVHLKTVSCVQDADCGDTTVVPLNLQFALSATQSQICATYAGSGANLPPEAEAQLDALIAQIGPMCSDLSLTAVTGLLGAATVDDVAISANAANDRIAIRLEMDTHDGHGGSSLSDWQSFLGGALSPSNGGEFSVFVDESMLRRSFEHRLVDDMTCGSDPAAPGCNDDLEPTSAVTSLFVPGVPEVFLAVDADADVGGWCAIDIGLEPITMEAPFALGSDQSSIQVDAVLDWDVNEWDVAACVFLNPFFVFTAPVPIEAFLVLDGIANGYSASSQLDGALPAECDLLDDHNVSCNFPFELPTLDLGPGPDAVLTAESVAGDFSGLLLEGSVSLSGAFAPVREPFGLLAYPATYGVHGSCKDLSLGYEGSVSVFGGPAEYCTDPVTGDTGPHLYDDKFGIYQLYDIGPGPDDEITVYFPKADPVATGFWDAPYDTRVTVWSTVGSGSVRADPPKQVTDFLPYVFDYVAAKVGCMKLETGWHGIPGWFDPHWLIDPGPEDIYFSEGAWSKVGGKAWLKELKVEQVGEYTLDERTSALTLPAKSVSVTATFSVESEAGGFEFVAPLSLEQDLVGAHGDGFDAVTLAKSVVTKIEVPRESLPRGLGSATVVVTLEPGELLFEGLVR